LDIRKIAAKKQQANALIVDKIKLDRLSVKSVINNEHGIPKILKISAGNKETHAAIL
jgi:hypothetical protein